MSRGINQFACLFCLVLVLHVLGLLGPARKLLAPLLHLQVEILLRLHTTYTHQPHTSTQTVDDYGVQPLEFEKTHILLNPLESHTPCRTAGPSLT